MSHGGVVLSLEGAGGRADEIEKIFSKNSTKKINETGIKNTANDALPAATALQATDLDETEVSVTQEELAVGKREVDHGGVRVLRRSVKEPASAPVNLREERVVIKRKPVDRAGTQADFFSGNQVIEFTETTEEAVIGKTARVGEEIHIGKVASDHTKTFHDTLRRSEVSVEHLRTSDSSNLGKR